ncbi:MAG: helix-turn-helix transcriptional regulator [Clostridia bacterium]|nr:helix-turn-helix transcriptional regulator [Clostridia bacterium]
METIGQRIHRLRKEKNLTQDDLAKKVGYTSRTTVNKVEKDLIDLPYSKIMSFCKALEVSEEYLLGLGFHHNVSFYDRVFALLKEKNISLQELGKNIGIDENVVVEKFNNHTFDDHEKYVEKVAKFFNVTSDFLTKGKIYVDDVDDGEKVRLFRIENGLSQEQLAKQLGYTTEQLQRIENNIYELSDEEKSNFAHLLCKDDFLKFFIDMDFDNIEVPTDKSYVFIAIQGKGKEKYYVNKEQINTIWELVKQLNKIYLDEKNKKDNQ